VNGQDRRPRQHARQSLDTDRKLGVHYKVKDSLNSKQFDDIHIIKRATKNVDLYRTTSYYTHLLQGL